MSVDISKLLQDAIQEEIKSKVANYEQTIAELKAQLDISPALQLVRSLKNCHIEKINERILKVLCLRLHYLMIDTYDNLKNNKEAAEIIEFINSTGKRDIEFEIVRISRELGYKFTIIKNHFDEEDELDLVI